MATKKTKKSSKKAKKSARKSVKSSHKKSSGKIVTKRKIDLVKSNFVIFFAVFVISVAAYYFSKSYLSEIMQNLFWMVALITGFIALTFVIVGLIFFFIKLFKK